MLREGASGSAASWDSLTSVKEKCDFEYLTGNMGPTVDLCSPRAQIIYSKK